MGPDTAKFSRFKDFKFVSWLILDVGNLKLNCLRSLLRVVLKHILFTYYMDLNTAKLSRLKWLKFVPRLILKRGIRKCQYFDPKLPIFSVANSFTAFFIYLLYIYLLYGPQKAELSRLELKKQNDIIIICQYETFFVFIASL